MHVHFVNVCFNYNALFHVNRSFAAHMIQCFPHFRWNLTLINLSSSFSYARSKTTAVAIQCNHADERLMISYRTKNIREANRKKVNCNTYWNCIRKTNETHGNHTQPFNDVLKRMPHKTIQTKINHKRLEWLRFQSIKIDISSPFTPASMYPVIVFPCFMYPFGDQKEWKTIA